MQKGWFDDESCEKFFSMRKGKAGGFVETSQQKGHRAEKVKGIKPLLLVRFRRTLVLTVRPGAALL